MHLSSMVSVFRWTARKIGIHFKTYSLPVLKMPFKTMNVNITIEFALFSSINNFQELMHQSFTMCGYPGEHRQQ
jgi:hypothetical protein